MIGYRWMHAALVGAAVLGAGQAHASLYTYAGTFGEAGDTKQAHAGVTELHSEGSYNQNGRISTQSVTASHGVIKAYAMAETTSGQTVSGAAWGQWRDDITLHNPLLTGSYGQLRLNFSYSYELSAITELQGVAAQGYYINDIDVSAVGDYSALAHRQLDNHDATDGFSGYGNTVDLEGTRVTPDGEISLLIDFIWGVPFTVSQHVMVQCGVGFYPAAPNATCVTDSSHSSYWNGISDVTSGGARIGDFTVLSASGTDYSHSFVPAPVPEPEQIWMLAVGAGVALLARRRARSVRR